MSPPKRQVEESQSQSSKDKLDELGDFHLAFQDSLTIDELCLRPRQALEFGNDVRRKQGFYDAPDDIILRSVITRRKNPGM